MTCKKRLSHENMGAQSIVQNEELKRCKTEDRKEEERVNSNDDTVIGIDLGTTNSCVGIWVKQEDSIEIVENGQGPRTTPSMLLFKPNGSILVGSQAMELLDRLPAYSTVLCDAKRLLAKKYSDPKITKDEKYWPFTVVAGADDKPMYKVSSREKKVTLVNPEFVSAKVLKTLKEAAEKKL